MRNNNFNRIAPFYDLLVKVIFGSKLEYAQKAFINNINQGTRLLIIGGGTGSILEWLPENKQLKIDYVELSAVMLKKAKKRPQKGNSVTFLEQDVLDVIGSYDIIIANFLLDCFNEKHLELVVNHLRKSLDKEGELYVTDFCPPSNKKQNLLLRLMHVFFRVTSRLESRRIKDIHQYILNARFKVNEEEVLFNQLVFSRVYGVY